MNAWTALKNRLQHAGIKTTYPRLAWIVAPLFPAMCAIVAAWIASVSYSIPSYIFTRDMAALTKVPPYVAFVSNMGVLYWCAACAISAFAAIVTQNGPYKERGFLIASASLTCWLLFDDLFMFHDFIAPVYLNIHESSVFIFYLFITSAYLFGSRKIILGSGFAWILGSSLCFFTISAAADQLFEKFITAQAGHWEFLIEDAAKILGLTFWLSFHALMACMLVRNSFLRRSSTKKS